MLLGALLAPMAFVSVRAQIRTFISISDASEQGGAAGEAATFDRCVAHDGGEEADRVQCRRLWGFLR